MAFCHIIVKPSVRSQPSVLFSVSGLELQVKEVWGLRV